MFFDKINEINSHDPGCVGCVALFVFKHSTRSSIHSHSNTVVLLFFFSFAPKSLFLVSSWLVLHGCWFVAGTLTHAAICWRKFASFGYRLDELNVAQQSQSILIWRSLMFTCQIAFFHRRLTCFNKRTRLNDERSRIIVKAKPSFCFLMVFNFSIFFFFSRLVFLNLVTFIVAESCGGRFNGTTSPAGLCQSVHNASSNGCRNECQRYGIVSSISITLFVSGKRSNAIHEKKTKSRRKSSI